MKKSWLGLGLLAATLYALSDGTPALGEDHPQGHGASTVEGNTFYKYPNGVKQIAETLRKPPAAAEAVTPQALLPRPAGIDATDADTLRPVLRSTSRLRIGSVSGAEGDVAKNEVVYSFGLTYKGIPLGHETSQNVIYRETSAQSQPILISQRNVPSGTELNNLKVDEVRERLKSEAPTSRQTIRNLEKRGLDLTRTAYAALDPNANIFIERRPEPSHLAIRKIKGRPAHLVWTYVVASDSLRVPLRRRFFVPVDAGAQQSEIDYIDLVYGADAPVTGSVKGTFWDEHRSAFSPAPNTKTAGLRGVAVTRGPQTVFTDREGNFRFPGPGAGSIQVSLSGPNCRIFNEAGAVITATRSGNSNDFSFNAPGDLQSAQVSAFKYVNDVAEFTNSVLASPNLPSESRPNLLLNLETFVNRDETCNAFWDGSTINFFVSGPCLGSDGTPTGDTGVNTAFSDVVFHEYGHGVDDALGGIRDGGYSEGFGDSVAVLLLRDHVVGKGWKRRANGTVVDLRDTQNNVQWEDVQDAEAHTQGTAYGGFVWSLIQALGGTDRFDVAKLLVFGAALRDPTSIPDAVVKSFLFDYESGGNHYDALKQAAKAHGLPYPKNRDVLADPSTISDNLLSLGDAGY